MKRKPKIFLPLTKEKTIDCIEKVIQDYIIQQKLEPGMELPAERDLAGQLGVSRFTLREALKVAKTQGLIEIVHGRKPRVAKPTGIAAANALSLSIQRGGIDLLELTEARSVLECQISRLAAINALPEHLDALRQNILEMEKQQEDSSVYVELDIEFHRILLDASKNRVFEIMLEPLTLLLRESRSKTMKKNVTNALTGHKKILMAIEKGNPEQAAQAMDDHMHMTVQDLNNARSQK